jgi:hypothetical protein
LNLSPWQIYSGGAMLASATENILDKAAMTEIEVGDNVTASFIRVALYVAMAALLGCTGLLGEMHLTFHWGIFALAPFAALMSSAYTHLLANVEATVIGMASYLAPLIFMAIDLTLAPTGLSATQCTGIALLSLGGCAFSLTPGKFQLRAGLNASTIAALLFGVAFVGSESYLFKHLHTTQGIDTLGFFVSLWGIACAILLCAALLRLVRCPLDKTWIAPYTKRTALSKVMDMVSSVCFATALTQASVSQVSGMEAAYPLVILAATAIAQIVFKIRLAESLDRKSLFWKTGAAFLLVIGTIMIG